MTIEEAVLSLEKHLSEPDIFTVRHNGKEIIVDVGFVYRRKDIDDLNGTWEGYPVSKSGRISCW